MKTLVITAFSTLLYLTAMGQANKVNNIGKQMGYANVFAGSFKDFKIDIQAAGIAIIPAATLDNDTLIIDYAYFSEGENRKGKMALSYSAVSERYEGSWKTKADNGNVYQGSIYLVFSENGKAKGKYRFMNSDYKITILEV